MIKLARWAALWAGALLLINCPIPLGEDYRIFIGENMPVVVEYNLQFYVPVPMTGERPVKSVTTRIDMDIFVAWKDQDGRDITGALEIFAENAAYRAEITLATKRDYLFNAETPFGYAEGAVEEQSSGDNSHRTSRTIAVRYKPTREAAQADRRDLTEYIVKPATGWTPVFSFTGPQYGGSVKWEPESGAMGGTFKPAMKRRAVATLVPAAGYTFRGLGADAFVHGGAEAVSFDAESGVAAISFGATDPLYVENYNLQSYVPVPTAGEAPVRALSRAELDLTATWRDAAGNDVTGALAVFELGTVYQPPVQRNRGVEPRQCLRCGHGLYGDANAGGQSGLYL